MILNIQMLKKNITMEYEKINSVGMNCLCKSRYKKDIVDFMKIEKLQKTMGINNEQIN